MSQAIYVLSFIQIRFYCQLSITPHFQTKLSTQKNNLVGILQFLLRNNFNRFVDYCEQVLKQYIQFIFLIRFFQFSKSLQIHSLSIELSHSHRPLIDVLRAKRYKVPIFL